MATRTGAIRCSTTINDVKSTLCVFMAYSSVLLNPLHNYVVEKLTKHFYKINLDLRWAKVGPFAPTRGSLAQRTSSLPKLCKILPCDPDKPTTKFEHPRGALTIPNLSEFARLYVGIVWQTKTSALTLAKMSGCF